MKSLLRVVIAVYIINHMVGMEEITTPTTASPPKRNIIIRIAIFFEELWASMIKGKNWFMNYPAKITEHVLDDLYVSAKHFADFAVDHKERVADAATRIYHVMYMGICPEKIRSTTVMAHWPWLQKKRITKKRFGQDFGPGSYG